MGTFRNTWTYLLVAFAVAGLNFGYVIAMHLTGRATILVGFNILVGLYLLYWCVRIWVTPYWWR